LGADQRTSARQREEAVTDFHFFRPAKGMQKMNKVIHILNLEDDAADAELIQATLEAADMACRTTVIQTRDQFTEALRRGGYDVILSDYSLPSYDGLSALRLMQELCPDIPFIFVSGTMGEDAAIEALTQGATDYVLKQKLSRLAPAVKRALHEAENRRERRRVEIVLRESEERFRTLAEKSLVGVYIIQDNLFRYVNPALAEIFGYEPGEIIDTLRPVDFLTAEDRERVLDSIRRRTTAGIESDHLEFHIRRKDGVIRTVEVFGSRALHQGRPAVLGTLIDVTERRRSEERLFQASQIWERTFDAVPDLIAILDNDFRIVQANKAMAGRLGLTPEECPGQICHKAVHGTEAPPSFCPHVRSLRDGKEHMVEVSEERLGGDFIVSTSPMFDSQGEMIGSVHVARDITERKKAEDALRTSQLQLTEAMDLAHIVYWEMDPASRAFVFNDPFYTFCGTTAEQEGGYRMPIDEYATKFVHPKDVGTFNQLLEEYRYGSDQEVLFDVEHRIVRRDGEVRHALVRARVLRDGGGGVLRVHGALQDITERKRAEEELDRVNRRNRLLLESAGEGIFGLDSEGKVIFINPVAAMWFGYDSEELIDKHSHELIHYRKANGTPYPEEDCPICMTCKDGTIHHATREVFWKRDGTTFPVEYTSTPIMENRAPVGAVVTFRDVTEREVLEKRLRQAQKMEAIGTLAGGIAHDFNNILGAIIGCTELAQLKIPEDSPACGYLRKVLLAGNRAAALVQQILTFSRQRDLERKPLQITLVIKEALKMLRASLPSTIQIQQDIKSHSGMVMADPTQVHQVLMNLCTNAGHAMRESGGVLGVSISDADIDSESAGLSQGINPGPYVKLTISDTGHGMDRAVLDRIFDPYFTTKKPGEGTGLGLAVMHGIVSGYGGGVVVESEPGKGTTFHVYLPRMDMAKEAVKIESVEPLPTGRERILFVDDEQILLDVGESMLEHLGYEVVTETSSIEALELFREQPERFDLVITDMTMPNMTGDKLARELMKIRPHIPIILCTGHSRLISEEKAKDMGISGLMMKPLVLRNLAKKVRETLDKKIDDYRK